MRSASLKYRRIVIVIVCVVAIGILLRNFFSRPIRYEIPAEYKGWILVQYGNPTCAPLRSQGVFRSVLVPLPGRVCTSDHHPDRWTLYKFEYVSPDGTRKSLPWNDHGRLGTQAWLIGYRMEDNSDEIFVGDEKAMNHSGPPPPQ